MNDDGVGNLASDAIQLYSLTNNYFERKPVMVAGTAYLTKDIHDKCKSIGFDFITGVPIK